MAVKEAPKALAAPKDVLAFAREQGVKIVDFKFVDLPGTWQHFSAAIEELNEDLFAEGIGFDGSSIRGFQAIHESDMLLVPDPTTAVVDPACEVPTLSLVCNVLDPVTQQPYSRDPRYIAQKAEAYLKKTGIADTSYWGPEAEFFIFDNVRFEQTQYSAFYAIDSDEGIWNSGANALEGRLLPRGPGGHPAGPPLRDRAEAEGSRHPRRSPSPRGRHGRPVRD
jgi:glutamine synthetase